MSPPTPAPAPSAVPDDASSYFRHCSRTVAKEEVLELPFPTFAGSRQKCGAQADAECTLVMHTPPHALRPAHSLIESGNVHACMRGETGVTPSKDMAM